MATPAGIGAVSTGAAVADVPTEVVETPPGTGDTGTGTGTGEGTGDADAPSTEEPASTGAGDQPPADETPEDQLGGDGRTIDKKTRDALAKLAKTDPAAAKEVRESYFRAQAFLKETGKETYKEALQEVRGMKAQIEALGGDEGITNLQTEVSDYRQEIEQFSAGSPDLINQLYDVNPAGVVSAASNALDILAAKDVEGFDRAVIPQLATRLEKAGVYSALENIGKAIEAKNGQDAYDRLVHLAKFFDNIRMHGRKLMETRTQKDPEKERLQSDRQKFETEKAQHYDTQIGAEVNRQTMVSTAKVVSAFVKDAGLQPEGRKDFVNSLNSKIFAAMQADKSFQRAAHAIKAKGDPIRTAEFIAQKFEELLPDFFAKHRNALYPNWKPKPKVVPPPTPANGAGTAAAAAKPPAAKPAQAAAAAGTPGVVRVTFKPPRDDIDWEKTSDTMLISGRAFMKSGKWAGKMTQWAVRSS